MSEVTRSLSRTSLVQDGLSLQRSRVLEDGLETADQHVTELLSLLLKTPSGVEAEARTGRKTLPRPVDLSPGPGLPLVASAGSCTPDLSPYQVQQQKPLPR